MPDKNEITIADLYPQLSADKQERARENWFRYLAVVKLIFERIVREKPELLPELEKYATLRKQGKNQKLPE